MIALAADVHVANHRVVGGPLVSGINSRGRMTLEALRGAFRAACDDGASAFVLLGDTFDSPHPEPQLIRGVQDAMGEAGCPVYFLLGNHEARSDQPGDHSLGPLAVPVPDGCCFGAVCDEPTVVGSHPASVLLLPYDSGMTLEKLGDCVSDAVWDRGYFGAVGMHQGIYDDSTPPYLRRDGGALEALGLLKLLDKLNVRFAFSGHWHAFTRWSYASPSPNVEVFQVGALCPVGWRNPGGDESYGTVLLWDGGSVRRVVVPGPRFYTTPLTDMALELRKEPGARVRLLSEEPDTDVVEFEDDPLVWVQPVGSDRARCSGAVAGASVDELVVSFVDSMDLPGGVDRDSVLSRVRGYMS